MTEQDASGERTRSYRSTTDSTDPDALCTTLLDAISAASDTPVSQLDPLYDVIDLEAASSVFAPSEGSAERDGEIRFTYEGFRVVVAVSDGFTVVVHDEPPSQTEAASACD